MLNQDSPLVRLGLRQSPNVQQLYEDIRAELQTVAAHDVWERMQHAHEARYCLWDMHTRKCRKPGVKDLPPGTPASAVFPWPEAADHEVRLTEEIIQEYSDLLVIAARRAQTTLAPSTLDIANDKRMKRAEAWGQVRESYIEQCEEERDRAHAQMIDYGLEYGHSLSLVSWREDYQAVPRTVNAEQLLEMVTAVVLEAAAAQAGGELDPEIEDMIISEAGYRFQRMLLDDEARGRLANALQAYDPDIAPTEAKRVVSALKRGGDVTYHVADVVRSHPDLVALKPGLNAFYPWATRSVQSARFVVLSDWYSQPDFLAKTETPDKSDRWSAAAVAKAIAAGPQSSHLCTELTGVPSWVMSSGVVGCDIEEDMTSLGDRSSEFQVLTVYYRSSAIGGVPAVYRTIFCPGYMEQPLHHEVLPHLKGSYPLVEYIREPGKFCLWDSRGIGELAFSDQEEMRIMVNMRSDNAALTVAPPVEVPPNQSGNAKVIKPRAQFPARRPGERGVAKIDLAGDSRPALESEKLALERSNRMWQRGPSTDPVVRQNRWERMVGDWLLAVKKMEKLTVEMIQLYVPERLRIGALDGQLADLDIDAADLQGKFSLRVEFDSAVLDPKTVEGRMKMLREYVASMDREGLLRTEPVLRLMTMMINPAWGKLLISPSASKDREDAEDLVKVLSAALNGIELPYLAGKNHKARAKMLAEVVNMPAIGEDGQPLTDESGQPMPGRISRILQQNPDVAALVAKRMKFEEFQAAQFDNAEVGRTGVEPSQSTAKLYPTAA